MPIRPINLPAISFLFLLQSLTADFIEYYHNEFIENQNYKYIEVNYENNYSRFVKFSYHLIVQNKEHYDQSLITLFIANTKEYCDLYLEFAKSLNFEQHNELNELANTKLVYYATHLNHSILVDKFLQRSDSSQYLCLVYHSPHLPRRFSNKIRNYFIKHSFEYKYDIKFMYFHFVFGLVLVVFALITFYIKWSLKKRSKVEQILSKMQELNKKAE